MKSFNSISARMLFLVLTGTALLRTGAHASSLDERFKTCLNTMVSHVTEAQAPDAKRKIIADFLTRMDKGITIAKSVAPAEYNQPLTAFQAKMEADYAALNGTGSVKVPDGELNHFAVYVQQDAEQADDVVYIGGGTLIIILILLILLL